MSAVLQAGTSVLKVACAQLLTDWLRIEMELVSRRLR
jgi:hypothetical protein